MLDITDLCLIRVSFICLKAVAFNNNGGLNRYTGGHVAPIISTIGLLSSAKFENTIWEFQITCQYEVINNRAGGCGMREGEVGDAERGMGAGCVTSRGDISCRSLIFRITDCKDQSVTKW